MLLKAERAHTRKVLLQCPQETRAPAGWGSGLAGPGWTGPRFIILLLEGDRQTDTASQHSPARDIIQCKSMLITPDVASGSFFFPLWNPSAVNPLITSYTAFQQSASSDTGRGSESRIRQRRRRYVSV